MTLARIRSAAFAAGVALAATAAPAFAEWQWVEDAPADSAYVGQEPRGPGYYQQEQRYEVRETYEPPYVTHTEVFNDRGCEITRSYLSDGNYSDERICSHVRIVPPHVFIIDRIGRHFDRLRSHHDSYYYNRY